MGTVTEYPVGNGSIWIASMRLWRLADGVTLSGDLRIREGMPTYYSLNFPQAPKALNTPTLDLGGTSVYYIHTDHLGSPRAISNRLQDVLWSWAADPFGTTAANDDPDANGVSFNFNLRFAGQYFDAETGLHYNYFRYYDPSTGRYITSDPIGIIGMLNGSADRIYADLSQIPSVAVFNQSVIDNEQLAAARSINTYIYASANPLIFIDPLGLKDYLDKCVGRYIQCANGQSEDAWTIRNWMAWKGCKKFVDKSCSTGFPSCCDSEYNICISDSDLDPEKVAVCNLKRGKCISNGRGSK